MLLSFGTSPASMIRSARGRMASTSSRAWSPSVATKGAARRSVAASMASRALDAFASGALVLVQPSTLSKTHDRRSPLFLGPPSLGAKALPFGATRRGLHDQGLARCDLVGDETRDMAVASMFTDRTEGLPELEMR